MMDGGSKGKSRQGGNNLWACQARWWGSWHFSFKLINLFYVLGLPFWAWAFWLWPAGSAAFSVWASLPWLLLSRAQSLERLGPQLRPVGSLLWQHRVYLPRHVELSWTRDQTCVPCLAGGLLIQCATMEVRHVIFQEWMANCCRVPDGEGMQLALGRPWLLCGEMA